MSQAIIIPNGQFQKMWYGDNGGSMKRTPSTSELGQRLEQWRKSQGFTREQVADNMKTIKNAISVYRLETGRTKSISNEVLEDYAQAINLTVDKLLTIPAMVETIIIKGEIASGGSIMFYPKEKEYAKIIRQNNLPTGAVQLMVSDRTNEPRLCEGDVVSYMPRKSGIEEGVLGARMAVVMTKTEQQLIRKVSRGSRDGLYHLTSLDSGIDPMMDTELLWAARVIAIIPE